MEQQYAATTAWNLNLMLVTRLATHCNSASVWPSAVLVTVLNGVVSLFYFVTFLEEPNCRFRECFILQQQHVINIYDQLLIPRQNQVPKGYTKIYSADNIQDVGSKYPLYEVLPEYCTQVCIFFRLLQVHF